MNKRNGQTEAPTQIFEPNKFYRANDFVSKSIRVDGFQYGRLPMCRAKLYQLIRTGEFPAPKYLGRRTTVWLGSALNDWLDKWLEG